MFLQRSQTSDYKHEVWSITALKQLFWLWKMNSESFYQKRHKIYKNTPKGKKIFSIIWLFILLQGEESVSYFITM